MHEVRTKGVSLRSFLATLERLRGRDAVDRTVALLDRDVRDALTYGQVVPSGWYPLAWHRALHDAAQRACGAGPELARRIGQEGTRADFQGVYKFVAAILSPETLLKQAPRVWRTYWDGGELEVLEARTGYARAAFRDCVGFDRNLWQNVLGGIETTLEVAGARAVSLRVISGGGERDAQMEIEARWS